MARPVTRVAVIGAGTIGTGWAAFYLSKGLEVNLHDIDETAARTAARRAGEILELLSARGLAPGGVARAGDRLTICVELAAAVDGVDFVQEAVLERYDVKTPVVVALDDITPGTVIIASSSSGLLMSQIQPHLRRFPERCLIAHPIHPVYLVPLVELVPGSHTDPKRIAEARRFFESLGKVPVVLTREIPGYLENRMAAALWREAVDLVHEGIASVEDVDKAITAGPGLRYALLGPLMVYHLGGGSGGVRHFVKHLGPALSEWWTDMRAWTEIPPGAVDALDAGLRDAMKGRTIAELETWRDERLVRLLGLMGDDR